MAYYIISTPDTVCELDDVKSLIIEHNERILLESGFPAVVPHLDPKTLIGDPEEHLSDSVCEMLAERGVLSRCHAVNAKGKPFQLAGAILWSYSWASEPFSVLSVEELAQVAWDLRQHCNFAHVSLVGAQVVESALDNFVQDDEVSPDEIEISEDEIAGMPWSHVLPPDHPESIYYGGDPGDED